MGIVKRVAGSVLLLGALGGAALGTSIWSLHKEQEFNRELSRTADAVERRQTAAPDSPQKLLEGPDKSPAERFLNSSVDSFIPNLKKEREKTRDARKWHIMRIAYNGGVAGAPEYEESLRDFAEYETSAGGFKYFLEFIKKFDDRRFAKILGRRLESGDFPDAPNMGNELELLKILSEDDPEFVIDYASRRLSASGPYGTDPKKSGWIYVLALSEVGGSEAVNQLLRHFDDKVRIEHADRLMKAVRTYEDGRAVYFFLQERFQNSQEMCSIRAYDIPEFKVFADQYGDGMKAIPCDHHDGICYHRPFGLAGMPVQQHCDPVECRCLR